jgi:hypothetical protein
MTGRIDQLSGKLAKLFTVCAILLVPWIGVLVIQLGVQAGKRSFNASWVGLDMIEVCCLLAVGALMRRRHRATSPVAAATAAVLCMDAFFDYMSAAPKLAYLVAMLMAVLVELPLAALLGWVAWRSLAWAAGDPAVAAGRSS